jgi:soluble lytic murein transglycosylase-like protein
VRYLSHLLQRFGDLRLALAAYNAGPGRVLQYGGVPPFPETQRYIERILG